MSHAFLSSERTHARRPNSGFETGTVFSGILTARKTSVSEIRKPDHKFPVSVTDDDWFVSAADVWLAALRRVGRHGGGYVHPDKADGVLRRP